MKTHPRDAFEICHEIYAAARELVDNRLPTSQMESSSKYIWRPDLHPRLVEYVADFALCGERALARRQTARSRLPAASANGSRAYIAESATSQKLGANTTRRASRLILFRLHYLGGAEYQTARRLLGLSELTWADWVDEIRERVGRELLRRKVFPPGKYFKVRSSDRKQVRVRQSLS